ncbi:hypothetical protein OCU04_008587 [Sclerotinia nivalis]|uniref:Uncharacterized protein n=1 Tax=Sclerotinia nivalis TaxID=352851 RepID=A0A9X0AID7_9HELO|nr:hypothetical protein OCU04_008587 [Sclerotinia nivalis]
MPHHLTSFFKSAAGVANDVLGNAVNMHSNSLKGNRNRNRNLLQREDQPQTESPTSERAATSRETQIFSDSQVATESKIKKTPGSLTEITTEITLEISKMSEKSKNCNPIDTANSTATNPNENLPPTPCLKAVDELDVLDAEVSPTDGLGGFNGEVGEVGGGDGSVDEKDGGGGGGSGMENTIAGGLETGGRKHGGVDATPISTQVSPSSVASSTNININTTSETGHIGTRNRAFTIPRKPLVTNRREYLDWKTEYGGNINERLECARGGGGRRQGERGEGLKSVESVKSLKSEVVGERKEERSVRLERERMERGGRDL